MSNWSSIPQDLLLEIAEHLDVLNDLIAFGGVCSSWRSAKAIITKHLFPMRLCGLKGIKMNSLSKYFYSFPKAKQYLINSPSFISTLCYSTQGWLVLVNLDWRVALFHPLTLAQIQLPLINSISKSIPFIYFPKVSKFVLSHNPFENSNYIVFIDRGQDGLFLCKKGDDKWFELFSVSVNYKEYYRSHIRCKDLIFFKEHLYALHLDTENKVIVLYDFGGLFNQWKVQVVSYVNLKEHINVSHVKSWYLVVVEGVLLVVSRFGSNKSEYDGGCLFRVFEVNFENEEWKEIGDLGDRAIFLSRTSNSVKALDKPHIECIEKNCIYFIEGHSIHVYSLRSRVARIVIDNMFYGNDWVVPA